MASARPALVFPWRYPPPAQCWFYLGFHRAVTTATGRSYSSFDTIAGSISRTLLALPGETIVHTGHGDSATIGAEAPHLEVWMARGHLPNSGRSPRAVDRARHRG
ncbi:hypothetical protein [Saccharopolyspora hattusasensis]|uniref:hypothetical protein n=1 Tax=Saccharopolyspora hattusasensis TaxID=1128679 RepID=UPI003D95ABBB